MGGGMSFLQAKQAAEERNVQDEARSFSSKLGAMRIILKSPISQKAFLSFCDRKGRAEYMRYFEELEKYKSLKVEDANEKLKKLIPMVVSVDEFDIDIEGKTKTAIQCLEPLNKLKVKHFTQIELIRAVQRSQDNLLTSLINEFEEYLTTEECAKAKDAEAELTSKVKRSANIGMFKAVPSKEKHGFVPIHV
jgi:hypothetical protein